MYLEMLQKACGREPDSEYAKMGHFKKKGILKLWEFVFLSHPSLFGAAIAYIDLVLKQKFRIGIIPHYELKCVPNRPHAFFLFSI